jgi:hypothetical protein
MPTRRKAPRPRNPHAMAARRLGQKIKPSAKAYRRRPKHKNPRSEDGGFSLAKARSMSASTKATGTNR